MEQFCRNKDQVESLFADLSKRVQAFWNWEQHPILSIEVKPTNERRSLDQNALFWKWMEELSKYFTNRGHPLTKQDAHDLMCHEFLGYQTKVLGKTKIVQLVTTTSPKKMEMTDFCHFMDQIDAWAADKGCLLPTPADTAYAEYKRKQGGK